METLKRKICVATGTRAEYGLLYWLMTEIQAEKNLELQILVTGSHLSEAHGNTWENIVEDGFEITTKVDLELSQDDSNKAIVKAIGIATIGFADALDKIKPDLIVILGDRYEMLALAQSALVFQIPLAHIHGGESTEGLIDEGIRHSITKMSHIHFPSTEVYKKRIIQLGENPKNIFQMGAPGIDNFLKLKLLNKKEFYTDIGLDPTKQTILFTYHPETLFVSEVQKEINEILKALKKLGELQIVFTQANADTSGTIVNKSIQNFVNQNSSRCVFEKSLGQVRYLSALYAVDVVVGNSSSGIIEAPFTGTPTLNVGSRQLGREADQSVFHVPCESDQIELTIKKIMKLEKFKPSDLYGNGNTSIKIKEVLKSIPLKGIIHKSFYNIEDTI